MNYVFTQLPCCKGLWFKAVLHFLNSSTISALYFLNAVLWSGVYDSSHLSSVQCNMTCSSCCVCGWSVDGSEGVILISEGPVQPQTMRNFVHSTICSISLGTADGPVSAALLSWFFITDGSVGRLQAPHFPGCFGSRVDRAMISAPLASFIQRA